MTFYNHILRNADRAKYFEEQQQLMLQVNQILGNSHQRYGTEKIRVTLAESGYTLEKRIAAIMRKLGLASIREDAKAGFKGRQQYQMRDLLNQEFTTGRQNENWVSDITYFKVKGYGLYLCVIIDLFSRRVVGWRVSGSNAYSLS